METVGIGAACLSELSRPVSLPASVSGLNMLTVSGERRIDPPVSDWPALNVSPLSKKHVTDFRPGRRLSPAAAAAAAELHITGSDVVPTHLNP